MKIRSPSATTLPILLALQLECNLVASFDLPKAFNINFPKIENPFSSATATSSSSSRAFIPSQKDQEQTLFESISNTQNGKTATTEQQISVLDLVSNLETTYPTPPLVDVLNDTPNLIDGTWFLQYTSPSEVETNEDSEEKENGWKIENAEENITTKQFNAKGSVAAAGITVDVSNRVPKQIFDLERSTVTNEVILENGFVRVGGPYRPSEKKENRAVVSFTECKITLLGDLITLDLGFLFALIALARGTKESGWLETTYLSNDVRIGRGNKGTMFVLTRDSSAVTP